MKLSKSDLQLETIVSRIVRGELDLQPDFQRGEIWDTKRRQRLVDTIIRDWYVPAVHIVIEADGREVVLDGQQRLAAIRDFITGELRIDGRIAPHNDVILSYDGMHFSDLPEAMQRAVNRFVLQTITLTEYEPQEPNELFFRLNQSYNLTPPEKRNALHGAARDQVKSLVSELVSFGLLSRERIGFSNGRLAYDDIIARACVAVSRGTLRQHINNTVVEDFYRSQAFSRETIDGIRTAGHLLLEQIDSAPGPIKFNKGTLQTWLVYCFWAPRLTGELPNQLLGQFERERLAVKRGEVSDASTMGHLAGVVSVYDDRASYRVTDVSSVVARDLAVHLFSIAIFSTRPLHGSEDLLRKLLNQRISSTQAVLFDYLEATRWDPLLEISLAK